MIDKEAVFRRVVRDFDHYLTENNVSIPREMYGPIADFSVLTVEAVVEDLISAANRMRMHPDYARAIGHAAVDLAADELHAEMILRQRALKASIHN